MDTAKALPSTGLPNMRFTTPLNDITMATARARATTMKAGGLQVWERQLLEVPEVKRKATVAQLCTSCPRQIYSLIPP